MSLAFRSKINCDASALSLWFFESDASDNLQLVYSR